MKKYLVVLAAAALVLVSCGPKEKPGSGLTALNFKQAELKMMVGDTALVALLAEPAEVAIPEDVVITSSDTNVVKVIDQRVNIVAVGSGSANITATVGDLTAVCKVTASTYEEAWGLDWLYYFPSTQSEKPLNDSVYTVAGYKCRLYSVEYFCPNPLDFDEDLTYGEGDCLFATVAALFIEDETAGDNNGAMVARQFQVVPTLEAFVNTPFSTLAGALDPAIIGPVFQAYFEGLDAGESPSIDWATYETGTNGGAHIGNAKITDTGSISYAYLWDGVVVGGWAARLVDQEAQAYYIDYDFGAQWCYGFWGLGLATNWEAESYSEVLVQPYALELSPVYNYKAGQEIAPTVGAPARKIAKAIEAIKADPKNRRTMEFKKAVRVSDLTK